ncbi:hypothetical protein [Chthonobacter rhizosphaerae]|uniref:hypothetical protein n=1 Tax=Chthonobacter rhizosphaerae TaxID=2735553 RepID=UPI0015EEF413|nr:hypothetical protein [Chthonobacter rhizosphaerae]
MFIAASHGLAFDYEVIEHPEGYLVRMRDLETGEADDDGATLFRTATAAFRYADLAASVDRSLDPAEAAEADVAGERARYATAVATLGDGGVPLSVLDAHRQAEDAARRRRLH